MSKENKSRNNKIVKLRKGGLSYRQIAKLNNLNVKTVFTIIKRFKNKIVVVDNSMLA